MIGPDTVMTLDKQATNFKPNGESSHAPFWITLPDLTWHYYEWDAICLIFEPIGIPLTMDKATISKSRSTTAKVRVELDHTRPLLYAVNVEVRNAEGNMEMFIQKVEYESTPSYCTHCRVQGHYIFAYRVLHLELRSEGRNNTTLANNKEQSHGGYNRNKLRDQRNTLNNNKGKTGTLTGPTKATYKG